MLFISIIIFLWSIEPNAGMKSIKRSPENATRDPRSLLLSKLGLEPPTYQQKNITVITNSNYGGYLYKHDVVNNNIYGIRNSSHFDQQHIYNQIFNTNTNVETVKLNNNNVHKITNKDVHKLDYDNINPYLNNANADPTTKNRLFYVVYNKDNLNNYNYNNNDNSNNDEADDSRYKSTDYNYEQESNEDNFGEIIRDTKLDTQFSRKVREKEKLKDLKKLVSSHASKLDNIEHIVRDLRNKFDNMKQVNVINKVKLFHSLRTPRTNSTPGFINFKLTSAGSRKNPPIELYARAKADDADDATAASPLPANFETTAGNDVAVAQNA